MNTPCYQHDSYQPACSDCRSMSAGEIPPKPRCECACLCGKELNETEINYYRKHQDERKKLCGKCWSELNR